MLFYLFTLESICLIKIIKTNKIIIMGAILMFSIVIGIALFVKLIDMRDEKRQREQQYTVK